MPDRSERGTSVPRAQATFSHRAAPMSVTASPSQPVEAQIWGCGIRPWEGETPAEPRARGHVHSRQRLGRSLARSCPLCVPSVPKPESQDQFQLPHSSPSTHVSESGYSDSHKGLRDLRLRFLFLLTTFMAFLFILASLRFLALIIMPSTERFLVALRARSSPSRTIISD